MLGAILRLHFQPQACFSEHRIIPQKGAIAAERVAVPRHELDVLLHRAQVERINLEQFFCHVFGSLRAPFDRCFALWRRNDGPILRRDEVAISQGGAREGGEGEGERGERSDRW